MLGHSLHLPAPLLLRPPCPPPPCRAPLGTWFPILASAPGAPEVSTLLPVSVYLGLPAPTRTPCLCPLGGHVPCVCFRGILVLWVPRERQAPWVLQAHQENLVLTA